MGNYQVRPDVGLSWINAWVLRIFELLIYWLFSVQRKLMKLMKLVILAGSLYQEIY